MGRRLVVQKYGGTSVGSIERIRQVAKRVAKTFDKGNDVVVVVSAMSGETNRLSTLASELCEFPNERELDVLLATGEQVTISLLAMCLQAMGYKAKSYLGYQIPILTDSSFTRARITSIKDTRVRTDLENGNIVVVAGFQGTDSHGNISTLGRGGSDTSAVAVAAAFKADVCEIYTDVEGVYTADPQIVAKASKIKRISYDEMLEMSSLGAKVMQIRSVEFAKKNGIVIHVRSSFSTKKGTLITGEDVEMESVLVSGVTCNKDEAKIVVTRVPDRPGIASELFTSLSDENICVDMIIQNVSHDGLTDVTFTVSRTDFKKALKIVKKTSNQMSAGEILSDQNIAKVSIVGVGMRSHSGIASLFFQTLASEGINIQMISTSEIKVSCIIEDKYAELAVRLLHNAFGLDEKI